MNRRKETGFLNLGFSRPSDGPTFMSPDPDALPTSGLPAWRSNGGPARGHPARRFPFTMESTFDRAMIERVHLLGIFAMYVDPKLEPAGTLGASLQVFDGEEMIFHHELLNGIHYSDATDSHSRSKGLGDGSSIATVGSVAVDGQMLRVDMFTLDLPAAIDADRFKFKSLSSTASFVIFDAVAEISAPHGCPFHSAGGGVPLARIGSIVRLGDRVEFSRAVEQLEQGVVSALNLDEARGQALTFVAVLTASLLEIGGSKKLVLEQLHASRDVERCSSPSEVWTVTRTRIESLVPHLFSGGTAHSDRLVDRALSFIERNYAKQLTDAYVAHHLGLSTSHFRFLFKQATGQPFHKYVIAARLEKAHQMLLELDSASVGSVAKAVGFVGLSHFSRAFTQRFKVSPANVRKSSA